MTTGASLPQGDARGPDAFDAAFVAIFAAIAGASSGVMLLVWAGYLRAIPLAIVSAIASAVAVTWVARSVRADRVRPRRPTGRSAVSVFVLAATAGVLFFSPAEYVFDGSDGSVYVAIASMLERHGTVAPQDPLAASLSVSDRAALFPPSPVSELPTRFPGGIEMTEGGERMRPAFFHLFPAWMASTGLILGSWARWYVNPVLALGSVLVVWLLGRRISVPLAGEVAAVLLAVNLAQVWFARVPSSEMSAQFLVLSGLYLAVLASDTQWPAAAAGAGAAFGLLAFARIDMLTLVTPAIAFLLVLAIRVDGLTRPLAWFAATFAALTLQSLVYAVTTAQPYTRRVAGILVAYAERQTGTLALAGGALAVVAVIVAIGHRRRVRPRVAARFVGAALLPLVAVLFWKDFTRGYFMQLVSPVGTALGIGGLVAMLVVPDRRRVVPIVLLFIAGMAYLRSPLDDRVMPGVLRRYVPILLPIVLLGVAHAAQTLRVRTRLGAASWLIPPLLGAWFGWHTWPILAHPVMRFGTDELAKVAAATGPSSLLVWDAGTPSHLALAAHTSLGRESVLAPYGDAADAPIRKMVESSLAGGRPVYLLIDQRQGTANKQPWRERLNGFVMAREPSVRLRSEYLVQSAGPFPFRVHASERRIDIYAIDRAASGPLAGTPLRIDLGDRDLPYLLDGFHPTEQHGEATVRWTGAVARLRIPPLSVPDGQPLRLVLRLATHRPTGVSVALDVEWKGQLIGGLNVAPGFAEYGIPLVPAAFRGGGDLTFRSETFVPRESGLGIDPRVLGVLMDWILLESPRP